MSFVFRIQPRSIFPKKELSISIDSLPVKNLKENGSTLKENIAIMS
jgi:hypothetical protein